MFKHKIKTSALVLGASLMATAFGANAAIFINEPIVKSFYGQPLVVEIPVQADAADWDTMWGTVELSNGLLMETSWKKPFAPGSLGSIEVRTNRPITEPVIDLKIRVESFKHQTMMYYPILIDKDGVSAPTLTMQHPNGEPVVSSVPDIKPELKYATTLTAAKVEQPQAVPAVTVIKPNTPNVSIQSPVVPNVTTQTAVPVAPTPDVTTFTVKPGDTLFKIAKLNKPSNMTTFAAMQKIYKLNKSKFGGSMDIIRAGVVLELPF